MNSFPWAAALSAKPTCVAVVLCTRMEHLQGSRKIKNIGGAKSDKFVYWPVTLTAYWIAYTLISTCSWVIIGWARPPLLKYWGGPRPPWPPLFLLLWFILARDLPNKLMNHFSIHKLKWISLQQCYNTGCTYVLHICTCTYVMMGQVAVMMTLIYYLYNP